MTDVDELDAIAREIAAAVRAWIAKHHYDLILVEDYPSRARFTAIMKTQALDMLNALHRALYPIALEYDFDYIDVFCDGRDRYKKPEELVLLRREALLEIPRA